MSWSAPRAGRHPEHPPSAPRDKFGFLVSLADWVSVSFKVRLSRVVSYTATRRLLRIGTPAVRALAPGPYPICSCRHWSIRSRHAHRNAGFSGMWIASRSPKQVRDEIGIDLCGFTSRPGGQSPCQNPCPGLDGLQRLDVHRQACILGRGEFAAHVARQIPVFFRELVCFRIQVGQRVVPRSNSATASSSVMPRSSATRWTLIRPASPRARSQPHRMRWQPYPCALADDTARVRIALGSARWRHSHAGTLGLGRRHSRRYLSSSDRISPSSGISEMIVALFGSLR